MTKRHSHRSKPAIPFPDPDASPSGPPVKPAKESNGERAERLRPHVERCIAEAGSIKAFAERAELGPRAIGRYLRRQVTPSPGALDAFEDLLVEEQREARPDGEGTG